MEYSIYNRTLKNSVKEYIEEKWYWKLLYVYKFFKNKTDKERVIAFLEKYNLPFVLLSDSEFSAIQAYGVWQEKKLYGKVSMGVVRTTFLIDEQGVIQAVMSKVKPDTNADEILALL